MRDCRLLVSSLDRADSFNTNIKVERVSSICNGAVRISSSAQCGRSPCSRVGSRVSVQLK